ncbi:MAG TPA: hypothetical protein VEL70_06625 [Candidatus Acidoferrum sp.]|nr:hypothetical protein [Candidatus Acidoferrum sp.]
MTPVNYIDLKTKKIAVKLSDIIEISLFATVVIYGNPIQSALWENIRVKGGAASAISEKHCSDFNRLVPMALAGNNLYIEWQNNDTAHWNLFSAKSTDGGKTLKTRQ